jgi:hypothetical protein
MNLDLIRCSHLFLVPSSFLVAALGTADTNLHRACVSLLGLVISVMWLICAREAHQEAITNEPHLATAVRTRMLKHFPLVFVAGWSFSLIMHLLLAQQALGVNVAHTNHAWHVSSHAMLLSSA